MEVVVKKTYNGFQIKRDTQELLPRFPLPQVLLPLHDRGIDVTLV